MKSIYRNVWVSLPNLSSVHVKKLCKQTPKFRCLVWSSGSTVGSHLIEIEVCVKSKRVWAQGLTLSSTKNIYTLRQHSFGNAVESQYRFLSRRLSYLVGDHYSITILRREACRCLEIPLWNCMRGGFHSVLMRIVREMLHFAKGAST